MTQAVKRKLHIRENLNPRRPPLSNVRTGGAASNNFCNFPKPTVPHLCPLHAANEVEAGEQGLNFFHSSHNYFWFSNSCGWNVSCYGLCRQLYLLKTKCIFHQVSENALCKAMVLAATRMPQQGEILVAVKDTVSAILAIKSLRFWTDHHHLNTNIF